MMTSSVFNQWLGCVEDQSASCWQEGMQSTSLGLKSLIGAMILQSRGDVW
jgi:hypothetical protein